MFAKHSGAKGTIWFGSLCIVFVLAFIQQNAFPHIAEAALLESLKNQTGNTVYSTKHANEDSGSENLLKAVSGLKNLTSGVSDLPVLSNVLRDNAKTAPPSTNQEKDSNAALPPVSTASAEKTSGYGLLPDLQVKTPSISVDTPLVNVDVPSAKGEVSTDRIPLVSINLPAAKVDTPIVQVKTPAIQAEVPLTPIPAPQIKVVTLAVQVKTPVKDIPVPSTSQSNLPLIEGGKANVGKKEPITRTDGAQNLPFNTSGNESPTAKPFPVNGNVSDEPIKLAPAADQWKDGSGSKTSPSSTNRAPDPPVALPRPKRGLSLLVPTEANALIEPQKAAKNQTGTTEATPIRTDPASAWFSVQLTLYTGNGSTGGGASFVTGSNAFFGSQGFLFPDILLPPPKIKNQNYEHSRPCGVNQWSKPPPAQPPRYTFFSVVVKQDEKECISYEKYKSMGKIPLKPQRSKALHEQAADNLSAIDQAIYEKRQQLNKYARTYGLSDPRCLHCSMELDELINAFNKMNKTID
ncbi:Spo0E family sporulation regulatory protein-aspartic acid phosphatase [Paenibacillus alginolyticus]|uniref:Spo0E family sporulation regulatory protein-aspartic acid phosphatase n=1 Tax=Paenibacillus alginolyticus TaxID=59839 RepID=A0ABT4GQ91_9BACL|nr:Spo0E family sporulation regulatory protein-aspartic acid phosphatase [Paenibacillus alginolyticus]MCY9698387.1 Spo0E family sporulation regulatory protein-aspartic acid phosphatase [Paenibacillus alginolyticus]MEC0148916.1 Spo0E family sporulation regulatory protein-aspartic acid phosphatase [Paenibacillus alginolyticus]